MAKLGAINMTGESGAVYKFVAYTLDTTFKQNRAAVFVVTRRRQSPETGSFKHRRIVMDQTDDLRQLLASDPTPHRDRGANCICVHGEKDEGARQAIWKDLRGR
jgi:hypothetical protein